MTTTIKRSIFFAEIALVIVGAVLGISFASGELMFYNVLIMPIIGAVSYFALKWKSLYALALIFVGTYIRWLPDTFGYVHDGGFTQAFVPPLFWAFIYLGFFALGMLIAFCCISAFEKRTKVKKPTKIIAMTVAFILIGGVLFVGNSFVGNPISKMVAANAAKKHLAENYASTDYVIEKITYNFKTGGYYARINSPSSIDTHFSIDFSSTGKIHWDSFDDNVSSGRNTLSRIDEEYRKMVNGVFGDESFPYTSNIFGGYIKEFYGEDFDSNDSLEKNHGIDVEKLVIDQKYDVSEIGAKHGNLFLYTQGEDISAQRASEVLLDVTRLLDEKNVTFYAINFVLEKPRVNSMPNEDKDTINLTDFLYSDITKDGLVERVQKAHDETMAYYAQQDAKNSK